MIAGRYYGRLFWWKPYPWGLIKHGESPSCLNSRGKRDIGERLWGKFVVLCTYSQALIFTWWLLTYCSQSCLKKVMSFGNSGPQIGFGWLESTSELPGRLFNVWLPWGGFISDSDSCFPAQHSPNAPTPKNGPQIASELEPDKAFVKYGGP